MKRIAFFDTKPYDRQYFDKLNTDYKIVYYENKLNADTAALTKGFDAVCAFVNDTIDASTIQALKENGVPIIALRSAGFNNVDFKAAYRNVHVVRVPAYSPYAVAEHTMALLLSLNRKTHKAYIRTRDFNFNLHGLTGFDLHGKTVGVIGTGKIGQVFINICKGFGMHVLAYDVFPAKDADYEYVDLETLFRKSDIISLHCPLTKDTHHIINESSLAIMKDGIILLNTSRGALIDSRALLNALNSGKAGGAALDVYEEEANIFFEDFSETIITDDVLALLLSRPNVIITSHQAFLTNEALENIAQTTLSNLDAFFSGGRLENEVCYQCAAKNTDKCSKILHGRCF